MVRSVGTALTSLCRTHDAGLAHRCFSFARVRASQTPPPIMKPPEMRDINRVRRAENSLRARPRQ